MLLVTRRNVSRPCPLLGVSIDGSDASSRLGCRESLCSRHRALRPARRLPCTPHGTPGRCVFPRSANPRARLWPRSPGGPAPRHLPESGHSRCPLCSPRPSRAGRLVASRLCTVLPPPRTTDGRSAMLSPRLLVAEMSSYRAALIFVAEALLLSWSQEPSEWSFCHHCFSVPSHPRAEICLNRRFLLRCPDPSEPSPNACLSSCVPDHLSALPFPAVGTLHAP